MKLEDARAIWLTLMGTGWVTRYDAMCHPQWADVLYPAYTTLRQLNEIESNPYKETLKIKCKS